MGTRCLAASASLRGTGAQTCTAVGRASAACCRVLRCRCCTTGTALQVLHCTAPTSAESCPLIARRCLQVPPHRRLQVWCRLPGLPWRPHAVPCPVLRAPNALPPAHHSLHDGISHARLAPGGLGVRACSCCWRCGLGRRTGCLASLWLVQVLEPTAHAALACPAGTQAPAHRLCDRRCRGGHSGGGSSRGSSIPASAATRAAATGPAGSRTAGNANRADRRSMQRLGGRAACRAAGGGGQCAAGHTSKRGGQPRRALPHTLHDHRASGGLWRLMPAVLCSGLAALSCNSTAAWPGEQCGLRGACLLLQLILSAVQRHTVSAPPRQPVRLSTHKARARCGLQSAGVKKGQSFHGHRGVSQLSSQGQGPSEQRVEHKHTARSGAHESELVGGV